MNFRPWILGAVLVLAGFAGPSWISATTGEPRVVVVGKDDLEPEPVEVTIKVTTISERHFYQIGFHQKTGGPAKGSAGISFWRDEKVLFRARLTGEVMGEWRLYSFEVAEEYLPVAELRFSYAGPGVGANGLMYRVPLKLHQPKDE